MDSNSFDLPNDARIAILSGILGPDELQARILPWITMLWEEKELVKEWARLKGVSLPTSGLSIAIDKSTGHDKEIMRVFIKDMLDITLRSGSELLETLGLTIPDLGDGTEE